MRSYSSSSYIDDLWILIILIYLYKHLRRCLTRRERLSNEWCQEGRQTQKTLSNKARIYTNLMSSIPCLHRNKPSPWWWRLSPTKRIRNTCFVDRSCLQPSVKMGLGFHFCKGLEQYVRYIETSILLLILIQSHGLH